MATGTRSPSAESGHCQTVTSLGDSEDLTSSVQHQLAELDREIASRQPLFSEPAGCRVCARSRRHSSGWCPPRHASASRHPLASVNALPGNGLRPRPDGRARPHPVGRQALYKDIGYALAPKSACHRYDVYSAALSYQVDATNLQRVLERRNVITSTGTTARSGRSGGRGPAALYRFLKRATASPTSSPRCAHAG